MQPVSAVQSSSWLGWIASLPGTAYGVALLGDPICVRNWIWSGIRKEKETSLIGLREEIRSGKERAGIRGEYSPVLTQWQKEIVDLIDLPSHTSPTRASPKNDLVYNHAIAQRETDKELEKLSRNASAFITFYATYSFLSWDKAIDPAEILSLVGKESDNPHADRWELYSSHFSKKNNWGYSSKLWHGFKYWIFFRPISQVIEISLRRVLKEIRVTTNGQMLEESERWIGKLEEFLGAYIEGKPSEALAEGKGLKQLCIELSPLLIDQFVPKIYFFEKASKTPLIGWFFKGLDWSVGSLLNYGIKEFYLKKILPGQLEALSEAVLLSLTADEEKAKEYSVNYPFAISLMHFINDKLIGFISALKDPSHEPDEPTPPGMSKKLDGVIGQIIQLSSAPLANPEIRQGIHNSLIDGGYQLMKYLQREPETLVRQILELAGLCFQETAEQPNDEEGRIEYDRLCEEQTQLLKIVGDEVFEMESLKAIAGTSGNKVAYHMRESHHQLKRYLAEGLSEVLGLKNSLSEAQEELKKPDYKEFDVVLQKHFLFWEGFASRLKEVTNDKKYPEAATSMLKREFYPLCQKGQEVIQRTSELQEEWMLYTRHRALEKNFHKMTALFTSKEIASLDFTRFQRLVEETEILLPPNPFEVQMLNRFSERLPILGKQDLLLKDLLALKKLVTILQKNQEDQRILSSIDALLEKNPQLQDVEFVGLYKKLKEERNLLQVREVLRKIDKTYQINAQILKEEQLNLLHRIHPTKTFADFGPPLSFSAILKECEKWTEKTQKGYGVLQQENLITLQKKTKDLYKQTDALEKKILSMQPHTPHFPLESAALTIKSYLGDFGEMNLFSIKKQKQQLTDELEGIVNGIRPLITAKKEEGRESGNLYSWIERAALYEIIQHLRFKNK